MCIIRNQITLSAIALISKFTMLHSVTGRRPTCKQVMDAVSTLISHFITSSSVSGTVHVLIIRAVKFRITTSPLLLSALYTYFSGLSDGANTYRRLNVEQRALCGQLSGIARVINISCGSGPG